MTEHLRIGELAARTGKSIHALRYYEAQGLMPAVIRDAGGRRQYSPQHVEWLLFLERLQRTGMTLAEMQRYATLVSKGRQTLDQRLELLNAHLERIEEQMQELEHSKQLLLAKLDFYRQWKDDGKRPPPFWVEALKPPTVTTKRRLSS